MRERLWIERMENGWIVEGLESVTPASWQKWVYQDTDEGREGLRRRVDQYLHETSTDKNAVDMIFGEAYRRSRGTMPQGRDWDDKKQPGEEDKQRDRDEAPVKVPPQPGGGQQQGGEDGQNA